MGNIYEQEEFCNCGKEDCSDCEDCTCEQNENTEPSSWDLLEPVLIDTTEAMSLEYNIQEFDRGMDDTSYIAGVFTALINAGFSQQQAFEYIVNIHNTKHAEKIAEIDKEKAIEMAKISDIKENQNSIWFSIKERKLWNLVVNKSS